MKKKNSWNFIFSSYCCFNHNNNKNEINDFIYLDINYEDMKEGMRESQCKIFSNGRLQERDT